MNNSSRCRLFIHVEEASMEEFLTGLLPRILGDRAVDWKIINHGSKAALLAVLPQRLSGYSAWNDPAVRILVLVDRDRDDCRALKTTLEAAAARHGLATKSRPQVDGRFVVANRVVVEELEAWFFGDGAALSRAFPRVSPSVAAKAGFRDPDAIAGGTWEALLRVLQRAGHYAGVGKLPKIEVARRMATQIVPQANRSHSFRMFISALDALISQVAGQESAT